MTIPDPGIIDLDCDSEEDCKYVDEDTTDVNLPGGPTCFQPVTFLNRDIVKPVCIKIVDCYKFPWYFDQTTKDIIENKLRMDSLDISISGQIMDVSSKELRNIVDTYLNKSVNNSTLCTSVNNNVGEQIIDINSNEYIKETDKCVNEEIDIMNRAQEKFSTRVINPTKYMASIKKRNDRELMIAMSQRNKTGVDLKKNKGLIGMKIQRITTNRQPLESKTNPKQQADAQKGGNEQKINKLFIEAVDKALINIGTTVTPVFDEILSNTSGITNDLNYTSARRDVREEGISTRINESIKVAEEIAKIIISQSGGIYHIIDKNKLDDDKIKLSKAMPLSKKEENEQKAIHQKENKNTLKQQKNTKQCKMAKMITPIPLSSKARKKEQVESLKHLKVDKAGEAKEKPIHSMSIPKKNTKNLSNPEYTTMTESKDINEAGLLTQRSDANIQNKSFKKLNKFTKNILNKMHEKQSKIKKPDKLHNKHIKKMVNRVMQLKSIDECNTKTNTTNEDGNVLRLHRHSLEETTKDNSVAKISDNVSCISSKVSLAQRQYSNKYISGNSPKTNQSQPDNHVQFSHHFATNTLPLNTIIMKTAETDDAKIIEANSVPLLENTHSNATISNNLDKQSDTVQFSTAKRTATKESWKQHFNGVNTLEYKNIEDNMKNKGNSKPMHIAQLSPVCNAAQPAADKYTIQTIITNRNEIIDGKHNRAYTANNIIAHTHEPKTQVSAMAIVRPTQTQNHQAQVKNKSLTVHNSMQSHTLYRPQGKNRSHQMSPMQQKNQKPVNFWYPPLYTEAIAPNTAMTVVRSPSEISIPQMAMNGIMPSSINVSSLPQMELNVPLVNRSTPTHIANNKTMTSGVNRLMPSQMRSNVRPSGVHEDVPPQMTINARPIPPRVIGPISAHMGMNARPQGVNVGIPPQRAMNDRPPGVCNIQPGEVFWSYAFPPPKLPPPPPPLPPTCQEIIGLLFTSQTIESSIIGRNDDGIIKKINITAPVADHNTVDSKEDKVKCENVELDSTPLYDEVPEGQPAFTEMFQVLNTGMQHTESPVKDLQGTFSPNKSKDLKSTWHLQRNDQVVDISKHKLPELTKHNYNLGLETMPIKSTIIPNSEQLFDDSTRPTESYKIVNESNLSHLTSKAPSMKTEKYSVSNNKRNFEDHNTPGFSSKRTDNTSLVDFKGRLPIYEARNESTTKYKPGPLSKKIKYNDLRASPSETETKEQLIPSKRYSSPILPIPTYEKILSDIEVRWNAAHCKKYIDRPAEANTEAFDIAEANAKFEQDRYKVDTSKKISLDEYKKRSSDRRTSEDKLTNKRKETCRNTVEMHRRASNVDSDLGYDSDVTVKL